MAVIGFRCYHSSLAVVVLDGSSADPILIDHVHVSMPSDARPSQLAWLRKEVREIVARVSPELVAYKAPEGSARTRDLGRAEAEGVLQEAVHSAGIDVVRRLKTQIRVDIGFAQQARYLENALQNYPALGDLPANRRDAALAALSALAIADA
jgi:hypothetical protein